LAVAFRSFGAWHSAAEIDMAMELWVFSDRELGSISEWPAAIDAEKFSLSLSNEKPLDKINGFIPAQLRGQPTGFECNHWSAVEFMRDMSTVDLGHPWKYFLAFRWRANFNELRAVWIAASAYARATDGIVFDDQEGKIRNAAEAIDVARREYEAPDPVIGSSVGLMVQVDHWEI
jgi:hypothetical protein